MLQYDGPVIRFLVKIADLILLNILWVVCCLPVITVGPATIAAHYVALRIVKDEGTSVVKLYIKSFRENLGQGIILGLAALLAGGILVLDLWLVMAGKIVFGPLLKLFILAGLWLLFFAYLMVMIYVWALMASFDHSLKTAVKNAFLLAVANLGSTVMMFCWDVTLLAAAVLSVAFSPHLATIFLAFGFPLLFVVNSFRLRKIIDRLK